MPSAAGEHVYVDLLLQLVAEFGIPKKLLKVLKIKCTDVSRIREESLSKACENHSPPKLSPFCYCLLVSPFPCLILVTSTISNRGNILHAEKCQLWFDQIKIKALPVKMCQGCHCKSTSSETTAEERVEIPTLPQLGAYEIQHIIWQ